jgi:tetratricopeptide (TPR) repeat protein
MKTIFLLTVICMLFSCNNNDYNYEAEFKFKSLYNEFNRASEKGEIELKKELISLLSNWESKTPNSSEMLFSHAWFYLNESIDKKKPDTLVLNSENMDLTRHNANVQYMSDSLYKVSQQYLDKAIFHSSNRIDYRFFQIRNLIDNNKHTIAINKISTLLDDNSSNDNWLFKNDLEKMIKLETKDTIEGVIQLYIANLYSGYDSLVQLKTIGLSKKMIKVFPENKRNYINIGLTYYYWSNLEESLKWFLRAKSIDEKDCKLLFTTADIYERLNQIDEAIKEYESIIEFCDSNFNAKQKIRDLEVKKSL